MRWFSSGGRAMRKRRNRAAWAQVQQQAGLKGVGGPAGPYACGRAILFGSEVDINWAAACWEWGQTRATIRRIRNPRQGAAAWWIAEEAMRRLHAEVRSQFPASELELDRGPTVAEWLMREIEEAASRDDR